MFVFHRVLVLQLGEAQHHGLASREVPEHPPTYERLRP